MGYLYDLVINPIELLLEIIYTTMYEFLGNAGTAIIAVSVAVSLLTLPMYLRADKLQEEESDRQKSMERWTRHIRKTFQKDERFMMQSAYYREMDYRPLSSLKGLLSLVLQIPFFIAAYHFLSHLEMLQGLSYGQIRNLAEPDALLRINNRPIHALPILMTILNGISGYIYTRGRGIREKLQVYLPALLFLILLYPSPSGLVIYWTTNNAFSLGKNIVTRCVKRRNVVIRALLVLSAVGMGVYVIVSGHFREAWRVRDLEQIAAILGIVAVLLFMAFQLGKPGKTEGKGTVQVSRIERRRFPWLVTAALILFMGLVLPLLVVSSSPQDFINVFQYKSPLDYVWTTLLTYIGIWGVWGGILYTMLTESGKRWYTLILYGLLPIAIMNFYLIDADMGTCDTRLQFTKEWRIAPQVRYGNMLLCIAVFIGCLILCRYKERYYKNVLKVLLMVFVVMAGVYVPKTVNQLRLIKMGEERVAFSLSRTGRNVVIIMLDRAVGAFIPFIWEERPELTEKYEGFVYYPNTTSSSYMTGWGAPAIFGGYDYLAEDVVFTDDWAGKVDEALTMLPEVFGEEGYEVTVSDVPFAGGQTIPDLTIYDDMPYVNAFHYGTRYKASEDYHWDEEWNTIERNFVMYALTRCMPAMLQDNVYDHGRYLYPTWAADVVYGEYKEEYRALEALPDNTIFSDEAEGALIMYNNQLPHEPAWLQLPDYELAEQVNNEGYAFEMIREKDGVTMDLTQGGEFGTMDYFVNTASYLQLAKWFDYLRENGVYDNTRIILVSDHGVSRGQFSHLKISDVIDGQAYNCLLMVKDFDAHGAMATDTQFMTNADVPTIATRDVIDAPVNPYTGNAVNMDGKANGINIVSLEGAGRDSLIYHVHDDIFDPANWSYTEHEEK